MIVSAGEAHGRPPRGSPEYVHYLKQQIQELERAVNTNEERKKVLSETEVLEWRLQTLKKEVFRTDSDQRELMVWKDHESRHVFDVKTQRDALHAACVSGSVKLIERCLQNGESINKHNENGLNPLHLAVTRDKDDVIGIMELLFTYKPFINAQTLFEEDTALHLAVRFGSPAKVEEIVEKLLEYNADTQIRNKTLRRPYDYAVDKGLTELAELLASDLPPTVALKYYVKKKRKNYGKVLTDAVIKGDIDAIRDCILRKPDMNFKNENGAGAIHYVITHCPLNKLEVLALLVHAGTDVNLRDHEDDTALTLAVKTTILRNDHAMYRIMRKLLDWGADPTLKDLDGKDTWTLANERNYEDIKGLLTTQIESKPESLFNSVLFGSLKEVEEALRQPDININARTKEGLCPIHLAVIRKDTLNKETILRLLDHYGADLDAMSKDNQTALHIAADNNDVIAARVLCDLGANTRIMNKHGVTAYILAKMVDHIEVADVISGKKPKSDQGETSKKSKACIIL